MITMRTQILMLAATLLLAVALCACSNDTGHAQDAESASGPYLAMARGQVDVEGGLVHVTATRDGRVDAVKVEDGDTVKQGDVLVVLDQRQARIAVGVAEAELAQSQAQVAVLKARLPLAEMQSRRTTEAATAGAATGQSADDAVAAAKVLKAQIGADEAAVRVARQHLDAARLEVQARIIKAPAAGRIVRRSVHVGDAVSAQAASDLFELLPQRPRIVRAELNEAYVDRVKPGMQAEVVSDTDQGKVVTAHVLRVGDVFGPSRLTDDPVERAGARDVECVLALDGGNFRIGQRVLVRFRR